MWASAIRCSRSEMRQKCTTLRRIRADLEFLKRVKKLLRHPEMASKQARVTAVLRVKQIRCAAQPSFIFLWTFGTEAAWCSAQGAQPLRSKQAYMILNQFITDQHLEDEILFVIFLPHQSLFSSSDIFKGRD